jgi:hypothetical protein
MISALSIPHGTVYGYAYSCQSTQATAHRVSQALNAHYGIKVAGKVPCGTAVRYTTLSASVVYVVVET